jgi:hypothetical protein
MQHGISIHERVPIIFLDDDLKFNFAEWVCSQYFHKLNHTHLKQCFLKKGVLFSFIISS